MKGNYAKVCVYETGNDKGFISSAITLYIEKFIYILLRNYGFVTVS